MPRGKAVKKVETPPVKLKAADKLHKVAAMFKDWRPSEEVFTKIRSVQTDLVQFDHATGVGGNPIGRSEVIHGESGKGKTAYCLAKVGSYLKRGNPVFFVDAEFTMDDEYFKLMCGPDVLQHPLFFGLHPENYEEVRDKVREFLVNMQKLRDDEVLPKDSGSLVVVDSIKKLNPKNLMAALLKGDEAGFDGMSGRGAMYKAALNAQWSNELIPLLHKTNGSTILVARENEDPDADQWARKARRNYKVGGGKDILFDASLQVRIERVEYVGVKGESKDDFILYGEKIRGVIHKTKLDVKTKMCPTFHFYTSNGVATPAGLDKGRDLLDIGARLGVITKSGSWFSYGEQRLGQGEHAAALLLSEQPDLVSEIETVVRSRFSKQAAPSIMEEDEEVVGGQ